MGKLVPSSELLFHFQEIFWQMQANLGKLRRTFGVLRGTFDGVLVLVNRWQTRAEFGRVRLSLPKFAQVCGRVYSCIGASEDLMGATVGCLGP